MRNIQLTKSKFAIVDDDDFEWISEWKWCVNNYGYAKRNDLTGRQGRKCIKMHRAIVGLNSGDGKHVDHINGNKLDNRKENLRVCSVSENMHNQGIRKSNTSGYKGVSWFKPTRKWRAQIRVDGKQKCLGYFSNQEDAHSAYCNAAIKHHGEFANFGSGCVIS